jgi:ABC-type Zn uptake system ZnuABC Zn-binding protein ZnuA
MKYFATFLFFCLTTLVTAQKKLVVVSSASIFDDMAKNIGGDLIEAVSIVPIGGDPHIYEATPADAKLVARADIILINGLTFEGWINEIIENSGTNATTTLITKGIKPIESKEHKNATDPHAWMDAENGLIYIKNIKDALVSADSVHAESYEKNYTIYANKIKSLHQYIQGKINSIPEEKRILITSHDAFSYFGKKYGMEVISMMGVSTEADAQTSDMERVVEAIQNNKVPAIFVESTINPKLLQQVSKDQKVKIGGSLYADSIGEEGTDGHSYYGMLKHNADVISSGLMGEEAEQDRHKQQAINWWMYLLLILILITSWIVLYFKIKK